MTLGDPQFFTQQGEDRMRATQIHTVDDHSLNSFQQNLEIKKSCDINASPFKVNTHLNTHDSVLKNPLRM